MSQAQLQFSSDTHEPQQTPVPVWGAAAGGCRVPQEWMVSGPCPSPHHPGGSASPPFTWQAIQHCHPWEAGDDNDPLWITPWELSQSHPTGWCGAEPGVTMAYSLPETRQDSHSPHLCLWDPSNSSKRWSLLLLNASSTNLAHWCCDKQGFISHIPNTSFFWVQICLRCKVDSKNPSGLTISVKAIN